MRLTTFGYLLVLLSSSQGKDLSCNSTQNVEPNEVYNISNPGYPQNYTPGASCRWTVICPTGYNCQLNCSEINLPQTPSCSMDRLLISKTGDSSLSGADNYCGQRTLNVTSTGQRLILGLISSDQSPGGRFYCQVNAKLAAVNPAPCSCGYRKLNRIIGGEEAGANEFPMMAGILYKQETLHCGAVIITKRHVMNAAQCLDKWNISDFMIVIGTNNLYTSNEAHKFKIISRTAHPLYNASTVDYDISILTLDKDIVFNERASPVCLPFKFKKTDFTGAQVTILGWGRTTNSETSKMLPIYLQKVDVNVVSRTLCRFAFLDLTPRHICTSALGKGSCEGDGGGPVLFTDPSNGLLYSVGIVSFSYGRLCGSYIPHVATRVTEVLDWIVDVTGENFCKL